MTLSVAHRQLGNILKPPAEGKFPAGWIQAEWMVLFSKIETYVSEDRLPFRWRVVTIEARDAVGRIRCPIDE